MPGSVRAALRAFQQRPALSFGIVALYALAVGFAGGLWATIDATLLRPLPYPDPARLVAVIEQHADRGEMGVTPASFLDWSPATGAFDGVGGAYALDLSFATGGLPTRVAGASVTEGYFAAWQVPAALGRTLSADDFTDRAWRWSSTTPCGRSTTADGLDVLGAPARIDGRVYTVVGVMPPTFRVPGNVHAWVPWMFSSDERRDRRSHLVGVVARLRAGTTPAAAARELETFYAGLRRAHVVMDGWSPIVRPLRSVLLGDVSRALTLMGAAVGLSDFRRPGQHDRAGRRVVAGAAPRDCRPPDAGSVDPPGGHAAGRRDRRLGGRRRRRRTRRRPRRHRGVLGLAPGAGSVRLPAADRRPPDRGRCRLPHRDAAGHRPRAAPGVRPPRSRPQPAAACPVGDTDARRRRHSAGRRRGRPAQSRAHPGDRPARPRRARRRGRRPAGDGRRPVGARRRR